MLEGSEVGWMYAGWLDRDGTPMIWTHLRVRVSTAIVCHCQDAYLDDAEIFSDAITGQPTVGSLSDGMSEVAR
jgi:hypothetical protein